MLKWPNGYKEVPAVETYEAPSLVDLGSFADLTQLSSGKANDGSEAVGSG
jgi:hypothetical protein